MLYRTDLPVLKPRWSVVPLSPEITSRYRAHYVLALTRTGPKTDAPKAVYDWLKIIDDAQGKRVIKELGFIPEIDSSSER